ncbi:MAG: TetR/AcrR family transcriptional regulator [Thiotrichales bacterium]|nr:TetR/AcrR family transcriptional regulator [Thiotrichales bacterium]
MQTVKAIQDDQAIRNRIMAAALARLRHYGYNKTTMAEIATDCDMSTANLYRYFQNKQEIASCCAADCINDRVQRVIAASNDATMTAGERLRAFVRVMLQTCHHTYSQDARMHELVLFITSEHPEIINDKIRRLQEQIIHILNAGRESGDFSFSDTETTARAVYSSIAVFDIPLLMNFYPLDVFQQRADEVVDLILSALVKRDN